MIKIVYINLLEKIKSLLKQYMDKELNDSISSCIKNSGVIQKIKNIKEKVICMMKHKKI